jgi:hypothetical protein
MKNKILYIHPAIRTYRVGIFELLSKKLKVDKSEIVKNNPKSNLLVSRTKEGVKYEEF